MMKHRTIAPFWCRLFYLIRSYLRGLYCFLFVIFSVEDGFCCIGDELQLQSKSGSNNRMLMTPRCLFHLRHIRHIDMNLVVYYSCSISFLSMALPLPPRHPASIFKHELFSTSNSCSRLPTSVSHLPALFFHYISSSSALSPFFFRLPFCFRCNSSTLAV